MWHKVKEDGLHKSKIKGIKHLLFRTKLSVALKGFRLLIYDFLNLHLKIFTFVIVQEDRVPKTSQSGDTERPTLGMTISYS